MFIAMLPNRFSRSGALLLASSLLFGCGNSEQTGVDSGPNDQINRCFFGDATQDPLIEAVFLSVAGQMSPMGEATSVPMLSAPQGGQFMAVGVRAKNLDGCPVQIIASLKDPETGANVALERRPIFLEPDQDGWLRPMFPSVLTNYANLLACPRANLLRDIHDERYELKLEISDKDGRSAQAIHVITPFCGQMENQAACKCECRANYRVDGTCSDDSFDAGLPDSGTSDGS